MTTLPPDLTPRYVYVLACGTAAATHVCLLRATPSKDGTHDSIVPLLRAPLIDYRRAWVAGSAVWDATGVPRYPTQWGTLDLSTLRTVSDLAALLRHNP